MVGSYDDIDYRVRPAKHAERLMLCETLQRLRFAALPSYQYVGLGSVYFSDFALFHRILGISDMVNIECQTHDKQRFEDNCPFSSIQMLWGLTGTELPKVNLSKRTIAWLDYDGSIDKSTYDDIFSFVSRAVSGSVLIISLQCRPPSFDATQPRRNVEELAAKLGPKWVDPGLKDTDLIGWECAKTVRRILLAQIASVLADRNGAKARIDRMQFEQVLNFEYKDGAHMTTIGGVFFDEGQRSIFSSSGFSELPFHRSANDAFRIGNPLITSREQIALQRQLPLVPGKPLVCGSIPLRHATSFAEIYRYFPNFAPVDL